MNLKKHSLIFGMQFGDEGKGKIIDYFGKDFDAAVRFNGGANAGHTVYVNGKSIVLNQIPSGIFNKKVVNIIAQGVILNIHRLTEEIKSLRKNNVEVSTSNFYISSLCTIVMPWHIEIDRVTSGQKVGSTVRGIGPASADKISRRGIRLIDLYDISFKDRFISEGTLQNKIIKAYEGNEINLEKEYENIQNVFSFVKPFITDTYKLVKSYMKEDKVILFEAAQALMIDIFKGTYPYVTSSICDPTSAIQGTGLYIDAENIGVFKAYLTRVGLGEMPTEIENTTADIIREKGKEYGASTGRPRRVAWLDIPMMKYALQFSVHHIAMTKLDILTDIDEIYICTKYWDVYKDVEIEYIPANDEALKNITRVYETMPSWKEDITGIIKFELLPKNAKEYIKYIEYLLDKKIKYISTGPFKENIIVR